MAIYRAELNTMRLPFASWTFRQSGTTSYPQEEVYEVIEGELEALTSICLGFSSRTLLSVRPDIKKQDSGERKPSGISERA